MFRGVLVGCLIVFSPVISASLRPHNSGLPPIQTLSYANGLRAYVLSMPGTGVAYVQVVYRVGYLDSRKAILGAKIFARGWEGRSFSSGVEAFGGITRVRVGPRRTIFSAYGPRVRVREMLSMEADSLHLGRVPLRVLRAAERRERKDLRWRGWGSFSLLLSRILGARSKGSSINALYASWYIPNNASILVLGDVTRGEVDRAVQRYFLWTERKDLLQPPPMGRPAKQLIDQLYAPLIVSLWELGHSSPAREVRQEAALRLAEAYLERWGSVHYDGRILFTPAPFWLLLVFSEKGEETTQRALAEDLAQLEQVSASNFSRLRRHVLSELDQMQDDPVRFAHWLTNVGGIPFDPVRVRRVYRAERRMSSFRFRKHMSALLAQSSVWELSVLDAGGLWKIRKNSQHPYFPMCSVHS